MSSSVQGKPDPQRRLVSDEEALVIPENARPTDDSPTVISKQPPTIDAASSSQDKIIDLARKPTSPEAIAASMKGKRLAHFELIEPIGVGGMAAVIRARDTQLDRLVALKILPPEMAQDKDNIERFRQEAKAAAKLDHTNIARVFHFGEDQGLHFIAFEYVEGKNLRTIIEQRGRLPVGDAIRYVLQVAVGLEHAASRGVVHRDVKPSNIIITPHGQAKLVDMGLARNLERHGERDLTQSGVTLGTFDYISPEQALEPREADGRSDIYSLGCTFYHLLTGVPPVPDGTPAKKLDHHQHHDPLDPRLLNPDVPEEIVRILGKMMAKRPRDRYQRPAHLVQPLAQAAERLGVSVEMPDGAVFVDAAMPSGPRHRPTLIIGMALAALVVVISVLSFAPSPTPKPAPPTPPPPGPLAQKPVTPPVDGGNIPEKDIKPKTPLGIRKAEELQLLLNDRNTARIEAKIETSINLGNTTITFAGTKDQTLIVEPKSAINRPTLRFEYDVASPNHTGIVLESGKEVVFKNLRFLIVTDASPESVVAMLGIQGVGRVRFEKCIFAQQNEQPLSAEGIPIASVAIESPTGADNQGPTVTFDECLAEGIATSANATVNHGGQAAVAINGPATVKATNCAFRPHGAFFHLRDKCSLEKTVVQVQNCAGLVQKGPAFRFDDNAFAQLTVNRNIFSNPGGSVGLLAGLPQPYLISLAKPVQVQYLGDHNRYHLNAMVEKKAAGSITTPEGFKAYIELNDGSDQNALYINPNPLDPADNPWQQTGGLEDLAFQLKAQPEFDNIGLRNTWMGRPMPPAPNIAKIVTTTNEKIVDADDKTPGIFNNIEAALLSAVNGDVIKIKHGKTSNEIPVALGKLKQNVAVTLKPFNDTYHPVLVLGQNKADATLFQLELKSRLQIEDMNIVLDPKEGFEKPDTRSVVQMGDAAVVFKKCTFTLRSTDNSVALNVVTFIGLEQMSKMEGKPGNPLVEFHDCFVRGKGNLVALRGCRKLHVKVAGSLIALNGSLLDIQATTKVMAMSEGVTWDMVGSSVYTTESLFAFHSNFDGGVLTENTARIDHCLIAALVAEQPVVFPDMPMAAKLKKFLRWEGEQNFYANFGRDRLMDWKEQFEKELRSGRLSFSAKLTDEAKRPPLWDAQTDWFRLPEAEEQMLSGVGLPVESFEKLLPPPEAPALPADEQ